MRYVTADKTADIILGRQGENEVVTVQFDVTGWEEEFGVGEFILLCRRNKDTSAYPCEVTKSGDIINWVVKSADVFYSGCGKLQLAYIVNDVIAKSVIFSTITLPSLDAGDSPMPDWIKDVLNFRLDSEAYALGTRDGIAVPDTDPTYHNNSKYYAQIAEGIKIYYADNTDTFETIQTALEDGYLPVTKYSIDYSGVQYQGTAIYGNLTSSATSQQYNLYDCTGYELITIAFKVDNSGEDPVYSIENSVAILTVDEPTQGSINYITSGGVWKAIEDIGNLLINKELITQEEWDSRGG